MKSFLVGLAAAATALFLSSCGGSTTEEPASPQPPTESTISAQPAGFNADDIAFATGMIPHHQQAVAMSEMVPSRSTNPEVLELARAISAAQGPEIETMKVLLVQWREGSDSAPETAPETHGGHGSAMPGMVADATMAELESLKGAEFDTLWLKSMIEHHQGAIEMSKAEIANGENADATNVAQQIITAQEAEIAQMKQILGG